MLGKFDAVNDVDLNGNPAGGFAIAEGISINWQNGPLGRDPVRLEPNGAFVETVIAVAKQRIEFYQKASGGKFACDENAQAIDALNSALGFLSARTAAREARAVEGTHTP